MRGTKGITAVIGGLLLVLVSIVAAEQGLWSLAYFGGTAIALAGALWILFDASR